MRDYSFLPCPHCGERLSALPAWAGRPLWKCGECGITFEIGVVYSGDKSVSALMGKRMRVLRDNQELDPDPSLALRDHSPDGFNWGGTGSGCAQLALALLLDCVGKNLTGIYLALELYTYFKEEVVANLPNHFELPQSEIRAWIKAQEVRVI